MNNPPVEQPASQQAWLKSILLKHGQRIFDRCAYFYARLCALPRQTRRQLKTAAGTGLTTLALALALSGAPTVQAATITVGGGCTLDQAIYSANNDMALGGCVAGSGADTIELTGDVTLTSTPSEIDTEMTINGNGHTIALSAGGPGTDPVLRVGEGGNLTLNDSTITGGTGGGIASYNRDGTVTITINNSTISGNSTDTAGGGIGTYIREGIATTTVTLNNSTISGNSGDFDGGGIYNFTRDGTSTITLNNSTVTGNSAENGGGGIFNYSRAGTSTINLNRSIVSGNLLTGAFGGGAEIDLGGGGTTPINAANYNVLGHAGLTNADAFDGFLPSGTDVNATSDGTNVALLSILNTTLADNGGGTLTHALVLNSPAVDRIPTTDGNCNAGSTVDQRGAARANGVNQGGTACDAGAFEYASTQTPTAVVMSGSGAEASSAGGVTAALSALMLTAGTAWAAVRRKKVQLE